MSVRPIQRKYSFSDGFLAERSDSLKTSLTRDQSVLAEYGVSGARISGLTTLRTALVNVGIDEVYMGIMVSKRQLRDEAQEVLYRAIKNVTEKVKGNWPTDEGKLIEFGLTGNISGLNPENLIAKGESVYLRLVANASGFASDYAVNTTTNNAFKAKVDALSVANTAFDDAYNLRKAKTVDRIKAANALYDEMIKLGSIGQNYWEEQGNPALYNEYVITNSSTPTPVVDVTVSVGPNSVFAAPTGTIAADTSILFENHSTDPTGDIIVYCATAPSDPIPTENATILHGANENHIAGDINYDIANTQLFLRNDSSLPIEVRLVVNG